MSELVEVAKIGRRVGLEGFCKLHLYTDFPQFFTPKRKFLALRENEERELIVDRFKPDQSLVKFVGFDNPEDVATLVHFVLTTTKEETRDALPLDEDEIFWFDLVGFEAVENGEKLGVISQIDEADEVLITITIDSKFDKKPNTVLLPWIDRFVVKIDKEAKTVLFQNTKELIEAL